jgi:hypothetical protein
MKKTVKLLAVLVALLLNLCVISQSMACHGTPPPPPIQSEMVEVQVYIFGLPTPTGYNSICTPTGSGIDPMFDGSLSYNFKVSQFGFQDYTTIFNSTQSTQYFRLAIRRGAVATITVACIRNARWGCGTDCSSNTAIGRWDGRAAADPTNAGGSMQVYMSNTDFSSQRFCQ